jgi:hypothetical protein
MYVTYIGNKTLQSRTKTWSLVETVDHVRQLMYTNVYEREKRNLSQLHKRLGLLKQKTKNYLVFRLCLSSGILENTAFRKLDLFPSSGEGKDCYSVFVP